MSSSSESLLQTIEILTEELREAREKIKELEISSSDFRDLAELKKTETTLHQRFYSKLADKGISKDVIINLLNIGGVYVFGSFITEVLLDDNLNNEPFISVFSLNGYSNEIKDVFETYGIASGYKGISHSLIWQYDEYYNVRVYYPKNGIATLQDVHELCTLNFLKNYYDGNWFTITDHRALLKKVHHSFDRYFDLGKYYDFGFKVEYDKNERSRKVVADDREKIAY